MTPMCVCVCFLVQCHHSCSTEVLPIWVSLLTGGIHLWKLCEAASSVYLSDPKQIVTASSKAAVFAFASLGT